MKKPYRLLSEKAARILRQDMYSCGLCFVETFTAGKGRILKEQIHQRDDSFIWIFRQVESLLCSVFRDTGEGK